jgi:hypothetical protein
MCTEEKTAKGLKTCKTLDLKMGFEISQYERKETRLEKQKTRSRHTGLLGVK